MLKKESKRVTADVLVIGSGMAGLRAAIEAKRGRLGCASGRQERIGACFQFPYTQAVWDWRSSLNICHTHGAGEGKKFADYFNGTIEDIFQKMVTEGVSIGWGYPLHR